MATCIIVDDSMFMRNVLKDIITGMGHQVIGEASNGREAISLYLQLRPDFVSTDVNMPVTNGIDAVREIVKADPEARVLICSSLGQHEVIIEAFKAGAKDFIVKPFQNDKIKQSITNLLK